MPLVLEEMDRRNQLLFVRMLLDFVGTMDNHISSKRGYVQQTEINNLESSLNNLKSNLQ